MLRRGDGVLRPTFGGRIKLQDCDGRDVGELDVEPCDDLRGYRISCGERYWHVDRTDKHKPIKLRTGTGPESIFRFQSHPDGEYAIHTADGYLCSDSRLSWFGSSNRGWNRLCANRSRPKRWERFSITVTHSNLDHLLRTVAPCYAPFFRAPDQWVVDALLRVNGSQLRCMLAAAGPPGTGKSKAWNGIASVVAQCEALLFADGGVPNKDGHLTLRQRRSPLLHDGCQQAGLTPPPNFGVDVADLVGVRGARELRCALRGQTRQGELWPTDRTDANGQHLTPEAISAAIAEIEARVVSPLDAAHVLLVMVTANTLLAFSDWKVAHLHPASHQQRLIDTIMTVARHYTANVPPPLDSALPPLPIHLVITQADLWAVENRCDDPRVLLGGPEGLLKPLYDAADKKLGFAPSRVTVLGWMETPPIDYANGSDPRVVVMKRLLTLAVQQGCDYAAKLPMIQVVPAEGLHA